MTHMKNYELPYTKDVVDIFDHFADLPYAVLLNSCQAQQYQQRFSFITADPKAVMTVKDDNVTIVEDNEQRHSTKDPFELIKQQFLSMNAKHPHTAIGYLSYDLAKRIHPIPSDTTCDIDLPDAIIGFYDWKITIDHDKKRCWLSCDNSNTEKKILEQLNAPLKERIPFSIAKQFESNMTYEEYSHAFNQIQRHILEGDCYEANFCQRFTATYRGSTWEAYKKIQHKNPAPFSAYLNTKRSTILSFSPERFLKISNGSVETKPIKGTSSRYEDPLQDRQSAKDLLASEKDRAENLMIVDLLRNDLGKSCKPGSIKVPRLFALESFPNVHHLVSTVTGQLRHDQHALDLLRACFPGGSITGAPKLSAMRIIEKLEPHHRSIYCGTIFHLDPEGNMDSNITIRTLICDENKMHCHAGGAIVADSKVENEYEETKIKVGKLISLIEAL